MKAPKQAGPTFLGIGAQKAASSWLYRSLFTHPDVYMPPIKELSYFGRIDKGFKRLHKKTSRSNQRSRTIPAVWAAIKFRAGV